MSKHLTAVAMQSSLCCSVTLCWIKLKGMFQQTWHGLQRLACSVNIDCARQEGNRGVLNKIRRFVF